MTWEPAQYLKFADHRLRPGLELMARVPLDAPAAMVDLGCGTGDLTRLLADRWPAAHVTGLDSSAEMLAKARAAAAAAGVADGASGTQPVWIERTVEDWVTNADDALPVDLIYSNATLHWVADHATLFPRLIRRLAPGGCLAVQMPLSWHAPSHRLMREVLASGGGGPEGRPLGSAALRRSLAEPPVMNALAYHRLLAPHAATIDIWSTEYLQVLEGPKASPPDDREPAERTHPVLEWVRGTGLRPVLEDLDDADRARFLSAYQDMLAEAYPLDSNGRTVYPFPRLFIVARR